MENSMEISQKVKKRATILFSNLTSGYISKENEIVILKTYQHPCILYSMTHYSHDMETTQVSISG